MKTRTTAKIAAFMGAAVIAAGAAVMPAEAVMIVPKNYEYATVKIALTKKKRVANSTTTQSAANSVTYQNAWLKKEKAKFPAGKYWNGGNPDSWTSTPCTPHGGKVSSSCTSFTVHNLFKTGYILSDSSVKGSQCYGYAAKLAKDYFGGCDVWVKHNYTSGFQFRVGDQIRIGNNQHSVFVTAVNGSKLTISDCNAGGTCVIRWDVSASISANQFKMGSTVYAIDYIVRPAMSGDIDGDSKITSNDVQAIRKILDYKFKYTSDNWYYNYVVKEAADVNNDGKITETDYYLASNFESAGYIKSGRYLTDIGTWVV